jgi:hypothetical protein
MSRSNTDKPFYVDVGTSIVAVRCASNHDVVLEYDHSRHPFVIELAEKACDRMNKEAEIGRPRRNCDVGTWEEQSMRFEKFCDANTCLDDNGNKECSCKCPACHAFDCSIFWSQMPYEEGGIK